MRDVSLWAVESAIQAMTAGDVYPLVVAGNVIHLTTFAITVPANEIWQLIGMSAGFDYATNSFSANSGGLLTLQSRGRTVTFPTQVTNIVATAPGLALQSYSSLFLSGVSAQAGDVLGISTPITNVTGVSATISAGNGQVYYIPSRLVASLSLERKNEEKSQLGLS